jgi:hypothetical protein
MQRNTGILALLVFFLASGYADSKSLQADLGPRQSAHVRLESAIDDAHLANPPGYSIPEPPVARVVERIIIENTGRSPIRNPDVRLNGHPLLPVADPLLALGLENPDGPLALFDAWRERRIHGTSDLRANREPLEVLQALGTTFCGDDSRALGAIALSRGADVRFARLNGHSAAEHRWRDEWVLLDGDQNAFYLRWDNRAPASEADILADPLLALRTKIYGRHARWDVAIAWQNTSRFEFVAPASEPKKLKLKGAPNPRNWELLPGEKLVIHLTRAPGLAQAASDGLRKNPALLSALCLVELNAQRRGRLTLPFPAQSSSTGEPIYEIELPGQTESIFCQAARTQFPHLRSGENTLTNRCDGSMRVTFETRELDLPAVTPPVVKPPVPDRLAFEVAAKNADRVWWQIAADPEFHLVPPNFDRVQEFTARITPDSPLEETFLSPGRTYFARAKVRSRGVWSDWSTPVAFSVRKPEQPLLERIEPQSDGRVRVRWKPADGEMLVFGSERIDFLPEIYGRVEPTHIENNVLREGRPNRNLLATVPSAMGEALVPARACYRLVARESGVLSVPSALARLPGRPARVLQNRHIKADGALTGIDVAVEMDASPQ